MKGKEGITLIALIITIIVMLILVGVTINVALNGGIFEKAKDAKERTQVQTEKEKLISIAVAAWDENQNQVDSTKINLGEDFESTDKTTSNIIVVKAKDTENLWQIDIANAKVEEYKDNGGGIVKSKELLPKDEESATFGDRLESGECPVASSTDGTIRVGYADFSYLVEYLGSSYEARLLLIKTENNSYVFAIDSISAQNYSSMINGTGVEGLENMQAKTWYIATSDDNYKKYSVYEDASTFGDNMSPIQTTDFKDGTIYSSSYLERVINSF